MGAIPAQVDLGKVSHRGIGMGRRDAFAESTSTLYQIDLEGLIAGLKVAGSHGQMVEIPEDLGTSGSMREIE